MMDLSDHQIEKTPQESCSAIIKKWIKEAAY
jgi:hypothetical protein